MLITTIDELLAEDAREITLQDTYWPASFIDVVQVMENELKETPELIDTGRAALLQFCLMWGGSYVYLPECPRVREFVKAKYLYDAKVNGIISIEDACLVAKVHPKDLEGMLQAQANAHSHLVSSDTTPREYRWCSEVIHIIDQLNEFLSDTSLNRRACFAVLEAILLSMSFVGGKKVINVPSCKGAETEIRKRLIFSQFNGGNARELARKYHVSVAHIYRSIKGEYKRRREAKKQMKQ